MFLSFTKGYNFLATLNVPLNVNLFNKRNTCLALPGSRRRALLRSERVRRIVVEKHVHVRTDFTHGSGVRVCWEVDWNGRGGREAGLQDWG